MNDLRLYDRRGQLPARYMSKGVERKGRNGAPRFGLRRCLALATALVMIVLSAGDQIVALAANTENVSQAVTWANKTARCVDESGSYDTDCETTLESSKSNCLVGEEAKVSFASSFNATNTNEEEAEYKLQLSNLPEGFSIYEFLLTDELKLRSSKGREIPLRWDKANNCVTYSLLAGETVSYILSPSVPTGVSGQNVSVTWTAYARKKTDAEWQQLDQVATTWTGTFGWNDVSKGSTVSSMKVGDDGKLDKQVEYTVYASSQQGKAHPDDDGEIWTDAVTVKDTLTLPEGVTFPEGSVWNGNRLTHNGTVLFELTDLPSGATNVQGTLKDARTLEISFDVPNPNRKSAQNGSLNYTLTSELKQLSFGARLNAPALNVAGNFDASGKKIENQADVEAKPYNPHNESIPSDVSTARRDVPIDSTYTIDKTVNTATPAGGFQAGAEIEYTLTIYADSAIENVKFTDALVAEWYADLPLEILAKDGQPLHSVSNLESATDNQIVATATIRHADGSVTTRDVRHDDAKDWTTHHDPNAFSWNLTLAQGETFTLTYKARVKDMTDLNVPDGYKVKNRFSDAKSEVVREIPVAKPAVTLEKQVQDAGKKYSSGELIPFTVTARNTSAVDAVDVNVKDSLPAGLIPTDAAGNALTFTDGRAVVWIDGVEYTFVRNGDAYTVEWVVPRLAASATSQSYTVYTKLNDEYLQSAGQFSSLTNSVSSDFGGNDTAEVQINTPKLTVNKTADQIYTIYDDQVRDVYENGAQKTVYSGDIIKYTVTVRNDGGTDALNVRVWDKMDDGLTPGLLTAATTDGGTDYSFTEYSFDENGAASVTEGENAPYTVSKNADGSYTLEWTGQTIPACSTKTYCVYAKVSKDLGGSWQSVHNAAGSSWGNQSDSYLNVTPSGSIEKTVDMNYDGATETEQPFSPQTPVRYKYTIRNNSTTRMADLHVMDLLPAGMYPLQKAKDESGAVSFTAAPEGETVANVVFKTDKTTGKESDVSLNVKLYKDWNGCWVVRQDNIGLDAGKELSYWLYATSDVTGSPVLTNQIELRDDQEKTISFDNETVTFKNLVDIDKKIIDSTGALVASSLLEKGDQVSYLVTIENKSQTDVTVTGIQDLPPFAPGKNDWSSAFAYGDRKNSLEELTRAGDFCCSAPADFGFEGYVPLTFERKDGGDYSQKISATLAWQSLTLKAGEKAGCVVTIKYPDGDEWDTWQVGLGRTGSKIENSFQIEGHDPVKVSHTVEETPKLYAQKGVYLIDAEPVSQQWVSEEQGTVTAINPNAGLDTPQSATSLWFYDPATPDRRENDRVTYYYVVSNPGAKTVTVESITDTLPAGVLLCGAAGAANYNYSGLASEGVSFSTVEYGSVGAIYGARCAVDLKYSQSGRNVTFTAADGELVLEPGNSFVFFLFCRFDETNPPASDEALTNTVTLKAKGNVEQKDVTTSLPCRSDLAPNDGDCTSSYSEADDSTSFVSKVTIYPRTENLFIPGATKEAKTFSHLATVDGALVYQDENVTPRDYPATTDPVNWEITLSNQGMDAMPLDRLTDQMDAPYAVQPWVNGMLGDYRQTATKFFTWRSKTGTKQYEVALSEGSVTLTNIADAGDTITLGYVNKTVDGKNSFTMTFPKEEGAAFVLEPGESVSLWVTAIAPKDGASPGIYRNSAVLYPAQTFDFVGEGNGVPAASGDGKKYQAVEANDSFVIRDVVVTSSAKRVEEKGKSSNYAVSSAATLAGKNYIILDGKKDSVVYTLTVENNSTNPIRDMVIVDNLPTVGDTGTLQSSVQRNSKFQVDLNSTPTVRLRKENGAESPVSATVTYSTHYRGFSPADFCADESTGTGDRHFSDSSRGATTDRSRARAFKLVLNDLVVQPNEIVVVTFEGKLERAANQQKNEENQYLAFPGEVAWNSFAYEYSRAADDGQTLADAKRYHAGPPRVGVAILGDSALGKLEFYKIDQASMEAWHNVYQNSELPTLRFLPGATFKLVGLSGEGASYSGVATSDANGKVLFDNLKPGEYILRETSAPAGYEQPGKGYWRIRVEVALNEADSTYQTNARVIDTEGTVPAMEFVRGNNAPTGVYALPNKGYPKLPDLPTTGGAGRHILLALGLLLMGGSLLTYLAQTRAWKKRRGGEAR